MRIWRFAVMDKAPKCVKCWNGAQLKLEIQVRGKDVKSAADSWPPPHFTRASCREHDSPNGCGRAV